MKKYLIIILIVIVANLFSYIVGYPFVIGILSAIIGVLWHEIEEVL